MIGDTVGTGTKTGVDPYSYTNSFDSAFCIHRLPCGYCTRLGRVCLMQCPSKATWTTTAYNATCRDGDVKL